MKSLIFKITWLIKMRVRFLFNDKKGKNIALVVNSFNKGGLEQIVLNLYYGYKKQGYNVYILSAFNHAPLAEKLYDIRDIYIFNNSPEKFIEFCYKKNINILHYHYNTLMMRAARQMGFKIIYTMHNVYTWFSRQELLEYKQRLDSANYVVCVSDYVRDYYVSLTGAKNAVTVPNGLSLELLDNDYDDFTLTREALGIKAEDIAIVMAASFYPVKHQVGMIGVMEQVIKKYPNAVLLCVGNIGDKEYYSLFKEKLVASSARKNIKHIEYIDNKYMGQFLRNTANMFILPTLQEGFGNSTIEGLYSCLPGVITDSGCAREVKKLEYCKVVGCGYEDIKTVTSQQIQEISIKSENINTQDIAKAIIDVIENIQIYTSLAEKNKLKLLEFSIENMTKGYLKLL